MTECMALLRGINVGRAKRIAMAQLCDLFVDLGHENARTVLSGSDRSRQSVAASARAGPLAFDAGGIVGAGRAGHWRGSSLSVVRRWRA